MIREFRESDARAVVAIMREVDFTAVLSEPALLHWMSPMPAQARLRAWVVEDDGEVVGWASGEFRWETSDAGQAKLNVSVPTSHRRRGHGAALYDAAFEHLRSNGARAIAGWAQDAAGIAFLRAREHRTKRVERRSALEPSKADLSELQGLQTAKELEGFSLVPLADVLDRPRELYELDAVASADEPSDYPIDDMRYEDWLTTTYEHPGISREGSWVVLAGTRPVAWALLAVDGQGRAVNEFTATHPDFRGRGLARLAKLAATAWARDNGVDVIYTSNDETNAPMLAINQRMGYEPVADVQYLVRELA